MPPAQVQLSLYKNMFFLDIEARTPRLFSLTGVTQKCVPLAYQLIVGHFVPVSHHSPFRPLLVDAHWRIRPETIRITFILDHWTAVKDGWCIVWSIADGNSLHTKNWVPTLQKKKNCLIGFHTFSKWRVDSSTTIQLWQDQWKARPICWAHWDQPIWKDGSWLR